MKENKYKLLSYMAILGIICITSFLVAKYIVRAKINSNDIPIDTSTRLE